MNYAPSEEANLQIKNTSQSVVADSRAVLVPASLSALATAALAACGGGGSGDSAVSTASTGTTASSPKFEPTTPQPTPTPPPGSTLTDVQAARFLLQAGFAANDADVASVRATGYADWLARQVALPQGITGWDWLESKGYGDVLNPNNYYNNTYPGDYMIWQQLLAAPDMWRKRAALALSEFFVVSLTGLDAVWRSHIIAHYWDTLAAQAFGNYRDLLEAVTLNPAMGFFLNTKGNRKEDASGRQPDENYAREVMQLFTIGLHQLNADGTAKTDAAGKKLTVTRPPTSATWHASSRATILTRARTSSPSFPRLVAAPETWATPRLPVGRCCSMPTTTPRWRQIFWAPASPSARPARRHSRPHWMRCSTTPTRPRFSAGR